MEGKDAEPNGDPGKGDAQSKLEELFPGARTIGECLHCHYDRSLSKFWQKPGGDVFRRQFLRYYEPWPEWALLLAVEVCRVYIPRVRKQIIYDSFKLLHTFIFELRLDGTEPEHPPVFPDIDARTMGTILGHFWAMTVHLRAKFDDAAKSGRLSQAKAEEFETKYAKQLSEEEFQREFQPHINRYFSARPTTWAEFLDGMSIAKRKTFDADGGFKETTSTPVYLKMLESWPAVEEMSGPTELCAFLDPVLVGSENDPEKKIDRVKKICSRLKIRFRPIVKG